MIVADGGGTDSRNGQHRRYYLEGGVCVMGKFPANALLYVYENSKKRALYVDWP